MNECISKKTEIGNWKIEIGACKLGNSWEERVYFWMPVRRTTRTRASSLAVWNFWRILPAAYCGFSRAEAVSTKCPLTPSVAMKRVSHSLTGRTAAESGGNCLPTTPPRRRSISGKFDPRERSHNIADAEPGHHAVIEINRSSAENDTTSGLQRAMAFLDERDDRLVGAIRQNGRSGFSGASGFFAMADAVNSGDQKAAGPAAEHVDIAGGAFTGKREIGNTVFDKGMV